jgi:VWFA-related protein
MHRRLRILTCRYFAIFLFSSIFSVAQSAVPVEKVPGDSTILKDVDEVSIDLVVHQGRNKPVLDLKPEDLEVTDDGAPVKLSDLRFVSGSSAGNHLITFLFDRFDPSGATNAREVAKKILKQIPTERFSFSVFSSRGRLNLLQGFTGDRQAIQKAVDLAVSDNGAEFDKTAAASEKMLIAAMQSLPNQAQVSDHARDADHAELASLAESQRIAQEENTTPVLAGLLALARSQAQIPGRKLLVYFTAGLRSDSDTQDMLRSIAGSANRANVSIYVINNTPVDSKLMDGLMQSEAMGALAASNRMNPAPTGRAAQAPTVFSGGLVSEVGEQITRSEGEGLAGNKNPAALMAASTGGAYLFSEDNLKKPFRQAVADLSTYYEASYVPPKREYDGKFHTVAVKPLRHGLKLQAHAAGYFAVPPAAGMRPYELSLMKIFSTPQLPADVRFRASVLRLGESSTGNQNTLVVEVPISSLETRSDSNTNLLSWHVLIVSEIKDKSGAVVAHFSEDVPGHGALNSKEEIEFGCTTMQRHFPLPPGAYTLETAVVDRNSGKMGGERATFDVADSGSGPFLGDLAVVRRIDPYPFESDPLEPLRYQHGRVVPSLSPIIPLGTKSLSFFFLVHPESTGSDAAMLQMEVMRNGELLGQMPLQVPENIREAFPYVASLNTASLSAGDYDVRLSLSQNGQVSERETSFSIPGPELANAALGKMDPTRHSEPPATLTSSDQGIGVVPARRQPLAITMLPPDSVVRPSEDELNKLISGAREYALSYSTKLPNFLCVEITDRAVDSSGKGQWHRKDSFAESLRFVNSHEIRKTLEFNGEPSEETRADMNGPISLGEFGNLLHSVFYSGSKADFHWKETDALAHGRVQVFDYRVERNNNSMMLSDSSGVAYAGFHGLVYIDSATMGIRRITMEANDVLPDFSIHAASIAVDYDYVQVGSHEYLMPARGTVLVRRGRHEADMNQVVFQDYRRYASEVKISVAP